jgi:hypothetical protein
MSPAPTSTADCSVTPPPGAPRAAQVQIQAERRRDDDRGDGEREDSAT